MKKIIFWIKGVWTGNFTYWWIVSLITLLVFDILWMSLSTFRPFTYYVFWPVLMLSSFFLAFPTLFSKNGKIQAVWLLFVDLLLLSNLMYYRTYFSAIPLKSYLLVSNLSDFSASVYDSFKWYYFILPLITILAYIFYAYNKKISRKRPNPITWLGYMGVFLIAALLGDAFRGGALAKITEMSEGSYLKGAVIPIYSLSGFWLYDYYKGTEKLTPQKKEEVKQWFEQHEKISGSYWSDSIPPSTRVPNNLVLILCESFESWLINKKVEGVELTPNLNKLISDSTTFYAPNVVTQVGNGRSIEAQLLILGGLLPMYNDIYAYEAIQNRYFTLPDAMAARGAKSYLLTADKPHVWNQAPVSRAFGWQTLIHHHDFIDDEPVGIFHLVSDGSLMRQIVDKMQNGEVWPHGEKAMIMVVTFSGHNPFNLPDYLRKINLQKDYPGDIKDYMITANYTDASIQTFIDYLKTRPDWEDTMVVITGDHEGLGSDRPLAMANEKTCEFVDPLQHTPLIILNSPRPGRYDHEMGQVDIYSTLLDLMGLNQYPWKGMGFSIFNPEAPKFAISASNEVIGNIPEDNNLLLNHVKKARTISDNILKFNLLENYPDSI